MTPSRRVLLFTGHRVDSPGRATPRFPADREAAARAEIRRVVAAEQQAAEGAIVGIAGGASGGDLLFHEVCEELGIPTLLLLALPPALYEKESVQDSGPEWVERFRKLTARLTPRILQQTKELPGWMRGRKNYTVWNRNNLWTLHHALAMVGGRNVTLIALWDGVDTGDGPGGTADMVARARSRGAKIVHIDTKRLFGLV